MAAVSIMSSHPGPQSLYHRTFEPSYPSHYSRPYSRESADHYASNPQPRPSWTPESRTMPYPIDTRRSYNASPTASAAQQSPLRPSLPPISQLMVIADREKSDHEAARPRLPSPTQHLPERSLLQVNRLSPRIPQLDSPHRSHFRPRSVGGSPRDATARPPYRRSDSVLDAERAAHASTPASCTSAPYYFSPRLGSEHGDRSSHGANSHVPSIHSSSSSYSSSPYASPSMTSTHSLHSDAGIIPAPPPSTLYQQRPLPATFPPPLPPSSAPSSIRSTSLPPTDSGNNNSSSGGENPYEQHHHHYISPTAQANFLQPQDRYLCPTCNKAFSRPSSLKIHSHSHTGEKPFRCPHAGCGKAFSVRSNMKRHERGCHTGLSGLSGLLGADAGGAGDH